MKRNKTRAIILRRTNYKEADRIISMLSQDYGRISVIARGVKRPKSRMAGGIEPFTISNIDFIEGKGELKTLVSARIDQQFKNIPKDYDRAALGGELLGILNEGIEDDVDEEYFGIAEELLHCLNDASIGLGVVEVWFRLQLLGLLGRQPELRKDSEGKELDEEGVYHFDPSDGTLRMSELGFFGADAIRGWRVLTLKSPRESKRVKGLEEAVESTVEPLRLFMAENSF